MYLDAVINICQIPAIVKNLKQPVSVCSEPF